MECNQAVTGINCFLSAPFTNGIPTHGLEWVCSGSIGTSDSSRVVEGNIGGTSKNSNI